MRREPPRATTGAEDSRDWIFADPVPAGALPESISLRWRLPVRRELDRNRCSCYRLQGTGKQFRG